MTVVERLAVLASGGVDSAVLVADKAAPGTLVQPLYIRFGLAWEAVEESYLRRFLTALPDDLPVAPLETLALPIADVYGGHWSVSGADVPDDSTPDEAVYLPGRNLLLLAKAMVWCVLHGIGTIALGTLKGNPFVDSSPPFFDGLGRLGTLALGSPIEVVTPFAGLRKADVLERGRLLPLEYSFSCIAPVDDRHCGRCNKCAERRKGFADAGVDDRTHYVAG